MSTSTPAAAESGRMPKTAISSGAHSAPADGESARPRAAGRAAAARVANALTPSKRLNLALQGGGAHGAFTWGVLDALLEDGRIAIDGVSGTSAGAVNAVALAAGLMQGGADGARECLHSVWSAVSRTGAPGSKSRAALGLGSAGALSGAVLRHGLRRLGSGWSPYDLNPLDINPLRELLVARIDFEKLQRESPVKLFIAATEVTSGRAKIFRTEQIGVDAVLASACLPTLFPAIKIGRFRYWDGGFSANPDLVTLISEAGAGDTLLVRINPERDPQVPVSADTIAGNIARLTFDQPLRGQIEQIEACRRARRIPFLVDRATRRLGAHRFHLVDASRHTLKLGRDTKVRPDWATITGLRDAGRAEARAWIDADLGSVGRRSSVDLYARTFTDKLPFD